MRLLFTLSLMVLAGCSSKKIEPPASYFAQKGLSAPTVESFQHCQAYGCKIISDVSLTKAEWRAIEKVFSPLARNAEAERKQISEAIGVFEVIVGPKTGTQNDIHGTFKKLGNDQHDCVDESINTAIYLSLLQAKGLVKHHTTLTPQAQFSFIRWPHQTAVMQERETGVLYAVDSWFYDNGHPAEIVLFEEWKDGWSPKKRLTTHAP